MACGAACINACKRGTDIKGSFLDPGPLFKLNARAFEVVVQITFQLRTTLRMSLPSGLGFICTPLDYERSLRDPSIRYLTRGDSFGLLVSKPLNFIYVITRAQLRLMPLLVYCHCWQFCLSSCSFRYVILGNYSIKTRPRHIL